MSDTPFFKRDFSLGSGSMHGGLCLEVSYFDNGDNNDRSVFTNQRIILSANCNEASIALFDENQLTPESLRKLANEMEKAAAAAHATRG